MTITIGSIHVPVSQLHGENPLPQFRDLQALPSKDGGLLPEERKGFGTETGRRVLPYKMQDLYDSEPHPAEVKAIILENEILKASFLPDYGGRLYSLIDKQHDRELLFRNPVIKIGNLALRNAWFSGGIEWNFGHYGHTFLTCEPVFFAEMQDESKNPFLRMYEYERCKNLFFQVDFHLPSGSSFLTAHMRIINTTGDEIPIFLWTNSALPERKGMRAFSGTDQVITLVESRNKSDNYFTHARLPDLFNDGVDHTDPTNVKHAEEYFFQNDGSRAFEAIVQPDGQTFFERSTENYPFRKVFLWGNHKGGKRWQDLLSIPGKGAYIEAQAGLFRTQQHTGTILPHQVLSLTQMFGYMDLESEIVHSDYEKARKYVGHSVDAHLTAEAVAREHQRCSAVAEQSAVKLLHYGHGWGALEHHRDASFVPTYLEFPDESMEEEQKPWLDLLSGKKFSGSTSFMITSAWIDLMQKALQADPENTALMTHLGIALNEQKKRSEARKLWQAAAQLSEDPLPLRNLAYTAMQDGNLNSACSLMEQAVARLKKPDRAYAEEYILWLCDTGQAAKGWAYYQSLPSEMQQQERLSITASYCAYEVGETAFLEKQFARNFASIREGEIRFTDLWFKVEAAREAKEKNIPLTNELIEQVRKTKNLPHQLDFRMIAEKK